MFVCGESPSTKKVWGKLVPQNNATMSPKHRHSDIRISPTKEAQTNQSSSQNSQSLVSCVYQSAIFESAPQNAISVATYLLDQLQFRHVSRSIFISRQSRNCAVCHPMLA